MSELLLQNLETVLRSLSAIPLYGSVPTFPLEQFAQTLSTTFAISPVKIEIVKTDFLENPLSGMGESPFIRTFVLSPIPEEFSLVIASTALPKLASALLSSQGISKGFSDESLQEGFLQVAFLNACQAFNELSPLGSLTVAFADPAPFPQEGALCHDLALHIGSSLVSARLICSTASLTALRAFHQMEPAPLNLDDQDLTLPIPLSYEVGSTTLSAHEWQRAKVGDCLLLDKCTLDPTDGKGTAILSSGGVALLEVRIKGSEAKVIDYMMQQERQMHDDPSPLLGEEPDDFAVEPEGELLSTNQIPLTLTVELGHFQMSLEKLAQLKPGNVLDLRKGMETTVSLTVGGKRVAKGELIRLGETIGVKILKVGE